MLTIEVCYGTARKQHLETLRLEEGSTLKEALMQALPALQKNFAELFPETEIDFNTWQYGIFSQPKDLNYLLKNHDRVEIYRPLLIDPMQKKQQRQAQQGIKKIPR